MPDTLRIAHQNYGEGVYELPSPIFADMILSAYEREQTADIKDIWKLYVIMSAINHKEIKSFDDWIDDLRSGPEDQENIDPDALIEKLKRDLGRE